MSYTFLQATNDTSDLTTYTFSSQNFGTASSDREIIVCINSRKAGAATTISSVTIGGVSATIHNQTSNSDANSNIAAIASANVPTGTSGDVVIVFGSGMVRCAIQLYSATGLASSTPYDINTSTTSDPTTNLDIPAGGFAIATALSNSNSSCTWTGLTEDHDNTLETFVTVTSASDEFVSAQSGLAITADFASSGTTPIGIFASWEVGAAGLSIDTSDSITITESSSTFESGYGISASDTVTIVDLWPGFYQDEITISESVGVEIGAAVSTVDVSSSESITLSEFNNLTSSSYLSSSEDISITENTSLTSKSYLSSSENISMTENTSLTSSSYLSANESISITESVSLSRKVFINASDSLTITESPTIRRSPLLVSASEIMTLSESVTVIRNLGIGVNDAITISESTSQSVIGPTSISINVSDPFTITESSIVNTGSVVAASVESSEDFVVTDSSEMLLINNISVSDDITLEDVLPFYHPEEITITDEPSVEIGNSITVSSYDDVGISESITVDPSIVVDVFESVSISDSSDEVINELYVSSSEDLSLSESINLSITSLIDVNDTVNISESSNIQFGQLSVSVSDEVSIDDVPAESLKNYINSYEDVVLSENSSVDQAGSLNISVYENIGSKYPNLIFVDGIPAWRLSGNHYTLI